MDAIRHLLRRRLIRKLRIDPNPVPRRPCELDHLRRRVPPHQIVLQSDGILLGQERSDLHAPASTRNRRNLRRGSTGNNRRSISLHPHLRNTSAVDARSLRRSQRKVDDAPVHKRSAIGDPHHDALVVREIGHAHQRPQRKSQVRSSHSILVVDRSIRALAPGIRRSIPARHPDLGHDRLAMHLRLRSALNARHIGIRRRPMIGSTRTTSRSR